MDTLIGHGRRPTPTMLSTHYMHLSPFFMFRNDINCGQVAQRTTSNTRTEYKPTAEPECCRFGKCLICFSNTVLIHEHHSVGIKDPWNAILLYNNIIHSTIIIASDTACHLNELSLFQCALMRCDSVSPVVPNAARRLTWDSRSQSNNYYYKINCLFVWFLTV